MAPKQSRATTVPTDIISMFATNDPSWDSSPITHGAWYYSLEDYLADQDARYSTLASFGYILIKEKVAVLSAHHIIILRDGLDNRVFDLVLNLNQLDTMKD